MYACSRLKAVLYRDRIEAGPNKKEFIRNATLLFVFDVSVLHKFQNSNQNKHAHSQKQNIRAKDKSDKSGLAKRTSSYYQKFLTLSE